MLYSMYYVKCTVELFSIGFIKLSLTVGNCINVFITTEQFGNLYKQVMQFIYGSIY